MKPVVIWNPAAARGRARRRWIEFESQLRRAGIAYESIESERSGHARELAAEAVRNGATRIAAFGGDGTLHDVVNGAPHAEIVFLPAGTSCDFAKRLPPRSLAERLTSNIVRELDAVRMQTAGATLIAVNGANIGFVANAVRYYDTLPSMFGSDVLAIASAIAAFRHHRPLHGRITIEGVSRSTTFANATVYATPYLVGAIRLPPVAENLGVTVFETDRRLPLLSIIPSLYRGRFDRLRSQSAHCVSIETDAPASIEADGEIVGSTPATFTRTTVRIVT